MGNLRAILMPIAILAGILLPQAHFLAPLLPFTIGIMMFLTFVTKIPPQTHGYTFNCVGWTANLGRNSTKASNSTSKARKT